VILFLGRLLLYKGLDELIPAFLGLDAPDAILLLAGQAYDPAMVQQLQQIAREHTRPNSGQVRFDAHFIPDSEIQVHMNAADIVALPYNDMPMSPASVVMAMGFGKPLISPEKGATPEIAGENCLFGYNPGRPKALAEALTRALNDTSLADRGREALERVRVNHSKERVAAAYSQAYDQLALRLGRRFRIP
jgi:glycosyltransferase involved in cell wall biosynthesis